MMDGAAEGSDERDSQRQKAERESRVADGGGKERESGSWCEEVTIFFNKEKHKIRGRKPSHHIYECPHK